MPRVARIKNNESVVYIIVKGNSDLPLFRDDEDKHEYIRLINKYRNIYGFKLYAYSIMEEYAHFIIDLCGADISSVMSSINIGYSGKYNRKYDRHGHVFHDRFKSKIIKDDLELRALTLYIHNSPICIPEYTKNPEEYIFSSLGVCIGKRDSFDIVDQGFIAEFIGKGRKERINYLSLVPAYNAKKLLEEVEVYSKTSNSKYYTKKSVPEVNPEEILDFISTRTGISRLRLTSKHVKSAREARAFTAFFMKNLCNYKTHEICSILGDVCPTNVSNLFNIGLSLVENNENYKTLMNELKEKCLSQSS